MNRDLPPASDQLPANKVNRMISERDYRRRSLLVLAMAWLNLSLAILGFGAAGMSGGFLYLMQMSWPDGEPAKFFRQMADVEIGRLEQEIGDLERQLDSTDSELEQNLIRTQLESHEALLEDQRLWIDSYARRKGEGNWLIIIKTGIVLLGGLSLLLLFASFGMLLRIRGSRKFFIFVCILLMIFIVGSGPFISWATVRFQSLMSGFAFLKAINMDPETWRDIVSLTETFNHQGVMANAVLTGLVGLAYFLMMVFLATYRKEVTVDLERKWKTDAMDWDNISHPPDSPSGGEE